MRDGRGGWPGGMIAVDEEEERNRYTCRVYANYKLASRATSLFFILRDDSGIVEKFLSPSLLLFNSSFFLYLFIFVRLFVRSFFSPSFFLLWRERETSLERETIAACDTGEGLS